MNRPKNSVIKSKSSNSAMNKSEPAKNKRSRSNAEIQPLLLLKKRGVYVANKTTKLSDKLHASNKVPKKQIKPPPVPRPHKKCFVNSVLDILSKSTAGTQHPEVAECNGNITKNNRRCERIKFKSSTAEDENKHDISAHCPPKKKQKYRSKILNERKHDVDKFVILQSRKDIVQTPSDYSQEPETIKWSDFLPPLVKNTKDEIEECIYDTNDGVAKHVLEGLKLKDRKVKLNENQTSDDTKQEDKGLYNFFVDLLETTFSIYNVKPEYDVLPIKSATSAKIALEINESVAKRLNFDDREMSDDVTQKPSKNFCCIPETDDWLSNDVLLEYITSQPKVRSKRSKCSPKSSKKLNTRSFIHNRQKIPLPTAQSFTHNNKKNNKKNIKKEFLDSIKEQLRMDTNTYEEPENLFQAMQLMATSKRKYQKSIRFESKADASNDAQCVYKRRKLISFNTKSFKKPTFKPDTDAYKSVMNNYTGKSSPNKKSLKTDFTSDDSEHSLEVYGFDYESIQDRKDFNRPKQIELMYHSTPAQSAHNLYTNDALLKYSASGTSSVQNYVNWNHGIQSVTKVMNQLFKK